MTIATTERQLLAARSRFARIAAARVDPVSFNDLVLRDEQTGRPVRAGPAQEEWHEAASQHERVVFWSHPEAGKSNQISIGRVLWELGRNPQARIAIISNTAGDAKKILGAVADYIERSEDLHAVFPQLTLGDKWAAGAITVRRPFVAKTPSVQAIGVHGNINGDRLDLVILDDILDYENTRTPHARDDLFRWLKAMVITRLTRTGRLLAIGNAYHADDALHRLAKEPGYWSKKFPVLDPQGSSTWPAAFSLERIGKLRIEFAANNEFLRLYMCVPPQEAESRIDPAWINLCKARGLGRVLKPRLVGELPDGWFTVTGVDLAISKKSSADLSCLFTLLVNIATQSRQPLWVESGRWTGPEIVRRIVDTFERYGGLIYVENNAAQDYLLQFTREEASAPPVLPFTTGRNKLSPEFGVESIITEFQRGQWVVPNVEGECPREVEAWLDEIRFYSPLTHTGDRLMASWIAREAARTRGAQLSGAGPKVGARVLGGD